MLRVSIRNSACPRLNVLLAPLKFKYVASGRSPSIQYTPGAIVTVTFERPAKTRNSARLLTVPSLGSRIVNESLVTLPKPSFTANEKLSTIDEPL
ncbi:hypothetical protein Poly51_63670 [Rubripirellula tenax]|uniref:Uncharacterized protein n=1 Tax=Rubripirellula tenax TaxID=2528015 RepID=A0A5C6DZR4_9BACT|nr:hypothetical protein Poly51_63670 [Rubripirellula tenax]